MKDGEAVGDNVGVNMGTAVGLTVGMCVGLLEVAVLVEVDVCDVDDDDVVVTSQPVKSPVE